MVPTKSSATIPAGAPWCMPTPTAATWLPSSAISGGVVNEATLPAGYSTALEGTFQAQEDARRLIGLLSLVSLGTIFLVLYGRYRSTVLSLIIMGNIPLALIGSV